MSILHRFRDIVAWSWPHLLEGHFVVPHSQPVYKI